MYILSLSIHIMPILIVPVRLVNGTTPNEGRVEVYYDYSWGTICDESWDINDANVICFMLGYAGASSAHTSAAFGEGTGYVILDNVNCNGSESHINQCGHNGYRTSTCNHDRDAGVTCSGEGMIHTPRSSFIVIIMLLLLIPWFLFYHKTCHQW